MNLRSFSIAPFALALGLSSTSAQTQFEAAQIERLYRHSDSVSFYRFPPSVREKIGERLSSRGYFWPYKDIATSSQSISEYQRNRGDIDSGKLTKSQVNDLLSGGEIPSSISGIFLSYELANQIRQPEFSRTLAALKAVYPNGNFPNEWRAAIFLAPTNNAWESLSPQANEYLFSSEGLSTLKAIIDCNLIVGSPLDGMAEPFEIDGILKSVGACEYNRPPGSRHEFYDNYGNLISERYGVIATSTVGTPTGLSITADVFASRLFAGPTQFPPKNFAAYGIVAFGASSKEGPLDARQLMICQSYVNTIRHSARMPIATMEQMVTVWPIDHDTVADQLNRRKTGDLCTTAVQRYGSDAAEEAIRQAQVAGLSLTGVGPYFIAWAPTSLVGEQKSKILYMDLSNVISKEQANDMVLDWKNDIEQDPELWTNGWTTEKLVRTLQLWSDKHGSMALSLFISPE